MKDNTFGSYLVLNMRRRVVKVLFTLLLMIYYLYMFLLCMGTIMLGNDLSENAAAITRSGMFVQTDFINTEATYARVHMSYGIWEGSGTVAVPISILEFLNVMLLPLVCFVGLMLMVYLYCRFYKENRAVKVIFIAGISIVSYMLSLSVSLITIGTTRNILYYSAILISTVIAMSVILKTDV